MGYVFSFQDSREYEQWCKSQGNRYALRLERQLMLDLLKPTAGETVLEIGSGTGASLIPFLEKGLQATGLEPSPYMIDIARQKLGNKVDFYRGFAEDLPFDDNSFDHVCFVTSLEFVDDPQKALEEAFRVGRNRVFLGILNRFALTGIQRRAKGMFSDSICSHARYFSIPELKQYIRNILGNVPITWRTVDQLPVTRGKIAHRIEKSSIIQRCPFGTFAGLVVIPVPRFRTRPLKLTIKPKPTTGIVAG